jgi:hypothetical protein
MISDYIYGYYREEDSKNYLYPEGLSTVLKSAWQEGNTVPTQQAIVPGRRVISRGNKILFCTRTESNKMLNWPGWKTANPERYLSEEQDILKLHLAVEEECLIVSCCIERL